MMLSKLATWLALSCLSVGCKSLWKSDAVLIGGERQLFFKAGTDVPCVKAENNRTGYYLLTLDEMRGIVNP